MHIYIYTLSLLGLGPHLGTGFTMTPNTYLGVPKWDPNFGN